MADPAEHPTAEITGDSQGQAELFGQARARGRDLALASPVVQADAGEIERKFGGRPAGATNVATAKRLELFARIGGDPLLASARILAMPTIELAAMLGCSNFEAEKFRQKERELVMPYVVSKRPAVVDVKGNVVPLFLALGTASAPGAVLPGGVVALLEQHAHGADVDSVPLPDDDDEIIDISEA